MLIDTHAHLDYPEFQDDLEGTLERARQAGVSRVLTIGTDLDSSRRAIALSECHDNVHAVIGIHPTNIPEDLDVPGAIDTLRQLAAHPRVAAIGETGLDHHRLPGQKIRKGEVDVSEALGASSSAEIRADIIDDAYQSRQAEFFHAHLELAAELGLNVVVHQRDTWQDTIELLTPFKDRLRTVFHCFTNSPEQAATLTAWGHLVSFTGILTFKNAADIKQSLQSLKDGQFMLETDCPYLAPEPHRGGTCEPAHTRLVAEEAARLRNTSLDHIATTTTRTAENFFRLK